MIKLNEDEYVLSISRRHWWTLAQQLIPFVFLLFVPVVVIMIWEYFMPQVSNFGGNIAEISSPLLYFGSSVFYLFLWLYFCVIFVDYYLDIWVVTNLRILDIEQKGLFNRQSKECYISNIEDLRVETKGILPTFLNYGDLHIKTASEEVEGLIFREIDDPNKIKNIILEQHNKYISREVKH